MNVALLRQTTENEPKPGLMLDDDQRQDLAGMTLRALAGSYTLMVKTQAAHWNVSGPLFKSIHDVTENQYKDLFEAIDDLAERIRALGVKAPMNFVTLADATNIQPFDDNPVSTECMIETLAGDHETLADQLAAGAKAASEIGDPATEDIFVERLRIHQKQAWMLRAMLAD